MEGYRHYNLVPRFGSNPYPKWWDGVFIWPLWPCGLLCYYFPLKVCSSILILGSEKFIFNISFFLFFGSLCWLLMVAHTFGSRNPLIFAFNANQEGNFDHAHGVITTTSCWASHGLWNSSPSRHHVLFELHFLPLWLTFRRENLFGRPRKPIFVSKVFFIRATIRPQAN